jgi:hypothetical protein
MFGRLCRQRGWTIRRNYRHLTPNQFRRKLWQSIELILSPTIRDCDVLSFDNPVPFKPW